MGQRWSYGCSLILALCLSLFLLGSAGFVYSNVPAFRDGYYFYYPQAVWLSDRAASGEVWPTWNSSEGLGVSVAGQPSSGLFYPLRVLWMIPGLSVAQRYSLVIAFHLLLAAVGMRWAAKQFGFSPQAQWLTAVSYALSGPIVFQHCNLIYLCSAAWIGFSLGGVAPWFHSAMKRSVERWWTKAWEPSVFAFACSMMLLAGDPHTAVNAILLAGLVAGITSVRAAFRAWRHRRINNGRGFSKSQPTRVEREPLDISPHNISPLRLLSCLVIALLLMIVVTAGQWLPALRWARHSNRIDKALMVSTSFDDSLFGDDPVLERIIAQSPDSTQRIYDFSLPPWYCLTAIWPTLGGHYLPDNSRLFDLLSAEGRMWLPSLYVGLVPFLLACRALARCRDIPAGRWLAGLLLSSWLASLGSYSIVWIARETFFMLGWDEWAASLPPDPFGSLYWLLTQYVPGYDLFRYPAKWSVWIAAALSLLGAAGMDGMSNRFRTNRSRTVVVLFCLSLSGTILSACAWWLAVQGRGAGWDQFFAAIAPDRLLGSPTLAAISSNCFQAFLIPTLLLGISLCVPIRKKWLPFVTLAEMSWVATHWLVFTTAPNSPPAPYPPLPPNIQSSALLWCPGEVKSALDSRPKLLGKLGLLTSPRFFNSPQSIEPRALVSLRHWLIDHDEQAPVDEELEGVLRALGVTHRLVRVAEQGVPSLVWHPIEFPHSLCELRPLQRLDAQAVPEDRLLDDFANDIDFNWESSDQLLVRVHSQRPAILLVRQFNDGGWQVDISSREPSASKKSMFVPAGSLFIQIPVPPGENHLVLKRRWFR